MLGQGLPKTDRELVYLCRPNTMSGAIFCDHVKELLNNPKCYLNTDEIQMLIAVLLRNNFFNHHVHVICPQPCQKIMRVYDSIGEDGDKDNLHLAMHAIYEYLDCTHDILERRYLAFLFNTGSYHWVTMVVVNPSFISNDSSSLPIQPTSEEQACGWFFFDSMGGNRKKTSTRMV